MLRVLLALLAGVCLLTSPAYCDSAQFSPLRLNGEYVRWFPGKSGKISLTYALADREVITPEATNCKRMRAPSSVATSASVSDARLRAILKTAFNSWESVTNISFAQTADAAHADIIIGEQSDPQGYAFTSILPGPRTANGFREISKAAICLNPARSWKDGIGGDATIYDLTYTLKHEIGHVIGLDHPSRKGQLMSFRYSEDLRDLSSGDIAGAEFIYGRRTVPTQNASLPATVGLLSTRP